MGGIVVLLELILLVIFITKRTPVQAVHNKITTAATEGSTPLAVTEPAEATGETEQIIWDIIPDDGPDTYGPNVPRNRFGPEDFGYENGYLTCLTEPCLLGIDVSSYQPDIDWQQVKDSGISFVMIRVGGRGYGEAGNLFVDQKAQQHYAGAKEAGLLVGAYFFSQAISEEEALEEAELALKLTKDWEMDLPLAFDWEFISDEARTAVADMYSVAMYTRVFCDAVRDAGRDPMVYLSLWFGYPYFEEMVDYPVWLARYTDVMDYEYHFDMWQYTASGTVPGIEGDVDLNIYFPPK